MKRIYIYILFAAFSVAIASCNNEELDPSTPSAESGDDVQFGLTLGDPETKTVYGDEANNAFPIYWINGDKVQIFSPQCLDGRRSAEYEVSVSAPQNYADALNKTGEYGVQWGDSENAIFYSLYPSGAYTLSSDGTEAQGITINYSQNIVVNGSEVKSDMEDCLMYAKNDGGEENERKGVQRGQTVNLKYTPISTVFMVTLKVASSSADDFTIQSVSLVAPTGTDIAGTFSLNISNGSFGKFADGKSSNTVSTQISDKATGGFYTLTKGNSVTIPLFLAPITGLKTDGWKIKVKANNNEYTKTLTAQDIVAGQIHKVTLPSLSTTTTEWETGNWMENIPRNVYLSEVSIPGSWNSINPDFQDVGSTDAQTIANQYAQGVRAFHLDTRWKAEYQWTLFNKVVGLGVADGGDVGSAVSSIATSGDKYMRGSNTPLVEDIISQLVGYIKNTPEEYMVLVCSFAQASINHEGSNGLWYGEISAICNKSDYTDYIVDATKVTANTLVGDVLGKILVIINMQDTISSATTLPSGSKCMFVNMPSELTSTRFTPLDNQETLLKNNTDYLWYSATSATSTGISMYNNQAQITSSTGSAITDHDRGYVPSVSQRSTVLNSIVNWSRSNYGTENYAHDKWIYLGLGGYQVAEGGSAGAVSGSYSTIASTYNTWIDGKVTEMGTIPTGQTAKVPYYPVGIVLMNFVNDYTSTVKHILLLNNAYRLQYDPDKPSDYNPNAKTKSAAPSYSSGMNDSNVAAFGWD